MTTAAGDVMERPVLTAEVAVADATVYYDQLYTYSVPAELDGHIFVGSTVLVPFGAGRAKPRLGVVLQLGGEAPVRGRLKALYDAAPAETRLTDELLAIVRYLKEATFCTWFEAVRAVIPKGAQHKVQRQDEGWKLRPLMERLTETAYRLVAGGEAEALLGRKPTPKQQAVLDCLKDGDKGRAELCERCGVGPGVAANLAEKGLIEAFERQKDGGAAYGGPAAAGTQAEGYRLTDEQRQVVDTLAQRMADGAPRPALLYGVTGSGKTAVFVELIRHALACGKTALVLVPEIGLTPQMLETIHAAFGSRVAVQHSGLSATERVMQWRAIQSGAAKVVVGTRSAVFAPLDDIGIIVVDEEQERTYQSESAPRYDAVKVAKRRAARHGTLLLLASATPSVASFYAARQGGYELLRLRQRYGELPLPAVEMVDMGAELMAGNPGALSADLAGAAEAAIEAGRQVILLLNRRGYHRVALCRECGESIKCDDCSVPMVFHKRGLQAGAQNAEWAEEAAPEGRLVCHHCGHVEDPAPAVCPGCGGPLRYAGVGTQRLEEELAERLPNARVLRMDMDTTTRKGSREDILARFGAGEADILLGTQMVAKGLDFERVSLVGVVGIDSLLFSQGYRAFETVFSLVTQVVGRSGRAMEPGRAIIQTVDPNNPVLQLAAKQDYEAFYEEEIGFRKLAMYPPFCTLCVVGFAAQTEQDAAAAARDFASMLVAQAKGRSDVPLRVLGPAPMQHVRIAGSYRWRLTLKCREDSAFREVVKGALADYNKKGWPRRVTVWLDFHAEG